MRWVASPDRAKQYLASGKKLRVLLGCKLAEHTSLQGIWKVFSHPCLQPKSHLPFVNYIQHLCSWLLLLRVLVPAWGKEANSTGNLIHLPAVVYFKSLRRCHLGLGRQRNNTADTSQLCRYWRGSIINSSAALDLVTDGQSTPVLQPEINAPTQGILLQPEDAAQGAWWVPQQIFWTSGGITSQSLAKIYGRQMNLQNFHPFLFPGKRGTILNQVQDFPLTALSGGIFPYLLGTTSLLRWFPEHSHFSSGVFLGHNCGQ